MTSWWQVIHQSREKRKEATGQPVCMSVCVCVSGHWLLCTQNAESSIQFAYNCTHHQYAQEPLRRSTSQAQLHRVCASTMATTASSVQTDTKREHKWAKFVPQLFFNNQRLTSASDQLKQVTCCKRQTAAHYGSPGAGWMQRKWREREREDDEEAMVKDDSPSRMPLLPGQVWLRRRTRWCSDSPLTGEKGIVSPDKMHKQRQDELISPPLWPFAVAIKSSSSRLHLHNGSKWKCKGEEKKRGKERVCAACVRCCQVNQFNSPRVMTIELCASFNFHLTFYLVLLVWRKLTLAFSLESRFR